MDKNIVITCVGPDQVGLVDRVTALILKKSGNIEESRMARLGGEFAMLLLVTLPESNLDALNNDLTDLQSNGYHIYTRETGDKISSRFKGWVPFDLNVTGADHEGILHSITHSLAEKNINVELLDTHITSAPMSGTPLFTMNAVILVPPDLPNKTWNEPLEQAGRDANVNISVTPYTG